MCFLLLLSITVDYVFVDYVFVDYVFVDYVFVDCMFVDCVFVDYVFVDCVFYFVFVRVAHMLRQVLDSLPAAYGLSRKQVQR